MDRSALMGSVRQKNTHAELQVRKIAHRLGFRFRLHRRDLPGTPDFVLPKWRTAVFVHGCFWHGHECRKGRLPKTNVDFWKSKIERNMLRDLKAINDLQQHGWKSIVIWECDLKVKGQVDTILGSIRHTCT